MAPDAPGYRDENTVFNDQKPETLVDKHVAKHLAGTQRIEVPTPPRKSVTTLGGEHAKKHSAVTQIVNLIKGFTEPSLTTSYQEELNKVTSEEVPIDTQPPHWWKFNRKSKKLAEQTIPVEVVRRGGISNILDNLLNGMRDPIASQAVQEVKNKADKARDQAQGAQDRRHKKG